VPSPTFPLGLVPGVVARRWTKVWAERVRRPVLEIVPVEEHEQVAALAEGRIRMCVARLPVLAAGGLGPEDLHVVRMYDERQVVLAPRDHVLAALDDDEAVALDDVRDELLTDDDLAPTLPARDRAALVAGGQGLLVVPQSVARAYQRKDLIWRPVDDIDPTTVALAWPRADDDSLCQEMVGIVKGRTARSSR
jgi:DNA-binding transcriptional LysR family regulator